MRLEAAPATVEPMRPSPLPLLLVGGTAPTCADEACAVPAAVGLTAESGDASERSDLESIALETTGSPASRVVLEV